MSTNMYWQPASNARNAPSFDQLKYVLAPYLFDHDGSLRSDPIIVDQQLVPFLRGVIAASRPDTAVATEAAALINAIDKYGEIELWIG